MRSVRKITGLATVGFAMCAASLGAFQSGARTIWDRVYTVRQAERGGIVAWTNCLQCHNSDDWSSPQFIDEWRGRRVGDLYTVIQRSMPEDEPGRLSPEEYVDIVAYLLNLNRAPAGDTELSTDLKILDGIVIQPADKP